MELTREELVADFLRKRDRMAAPRSRGTLTAEQVLRESALLASALREKPEDIVNPSKAMLPNRGKMNTEELYSRLEKLSTEPLDYKAVEEANRGKRTAARKDIGAGLMLSMRGDDQMARAGGSILTQALGNAKPLRMNAADVAYEGADGRMVENPAVERASREKVIQSRIDAQIREQKALMDAADRDNDRAAREVAARNLERLATQKTSVNIYQANTAEGKGGAGGKGLKAVPVGQQRDLETKTTTAEELWRLNDTFDDSYAGMGMLGRPGVALGSMLGSWAPEDKQPMINWWREFKMMSELPQRNKLFGATLTNNEQAEWKRAQSVNPDSKAEFVKDAIARMHYISVNVHKRMSEQLRTEGKNVDAYNLPEGMGADLRKPSEERRKVKVVELP